MKTLTQNDIGDDGFSNNNKINIISKKDQFRSRMGSQLIIEQGVALKERLKRQSLIDIQPPPQEQYNSDDFSLQYEELDKIGEGSHSVVKKCLHRVNNTFYTVKIIRTHDPEIINLEFQMVKGLIHENILKMHEIFVDEKSGYIRMVSEYSEGVITLRKYLQQNEKGKLSDKIISNITRQVLSVLSYLHLKKIIHRDIKPQNILIHPESLKIIVIDFGVSKDISSDGESSTPTGTPLYKCPEMIQCEHYTEKIDCWALGVTLYEMFTSTKPFTFYHNEEDMLERMLNKSYENSSKFKSLSRDAQNLIGQLLEHDSMKRISAREALKHQFIRQNTGDNNKILCVQSNNSFVSCQFTPPKKKNINWDLAEKSRLTQSSDVNTHLYLRNGKFPQIQRTMKYHTPNHQEIFDENVQHRDEQQLKLTDYQKTNHLLKSEGKDKDENCSAFSIEINRFC